MKNTTIKTQQEVAASILKECYWGNTAMSADYILEHIHDKEFARSIFSSIFQNSPHICYHLSIFDVKHIQCFIKERQGRKQTAFKAEFFARRLAALQSIYVDNKEIRGLEWNRALKNSTHNKTFF